MTETNPRALINQAEEFFYLSKLLYVPMTTESTSPPDMNVFMLNTPRLVLLLYTWCT